MDSPMEREVKTYGGDFCEIPAARMAQDNQRGREEFLNRAGL